MATTELSGPGAPGMSHPKPTPMMEQYLRMRAEVPENTVLFYRMGDFYELFFEDAVRVGTALDIAVTRRGKHLGEPIPMCGVPVHSSEGYIGKLLRAGISVAVCEQVESREAARRRGPGSVVARDIVRLVTPGSVPEPEEREPGPFATELAAHRTAMREAEAAGEPVRLNERLATLAHIEETRHYWDEAARIFTIEHEGTAYDVAAYTLGQVERVELEFHTFEKTEDGLCAVPSPADRHGRGRHKVRRTK